MKLKFKQLMNLKSKKIQTEPMSFLCLAPNLGSFIPIFANVVDPLQKLLKKDKLGDGGSTKLLKICWLYWNKF